MFVRKHMILIMVAILVLVSIGAWAMPPIKELWHLYARPTQEDKITAPSPLSEVTSDHLTIQLVHAISSSSHTVVQFALKHPDFPNNLEAMYRYSLFSPLQPGKDLTLKGFAESAVYSRREGREPGTLLLLLELPAPARPNTPVTIAFHQLRIHDAARQKVLTFQGPWTFTFVPRRTTAQKQMERIPLNQIVTTGPVHVEVRDMFLSETESVLTYRFPATVQMLDSPQLTCGEYAYPGRDRGGLDGEWQQVSFPALPPDVSTCQVTFGPFLTFVPADIRFTLHWDRLTRGGEEVKGDKYAWHFKPPVVMVDRTEITYTPANEAARRLVLVTSTDTVQVRDEKGVVYPVESWQLGLDPKTWTVEQQVLYLQGMTEPREYLDMHITQVGHIVEAVSLKVPLGK